MKTATDQIPFGEPTSAGTYECVDCGERIEVEDVDEMPTCPADDGHHRTYAWRPVDPSDPPREITGEAPVGVE